MQQPPTFHNLRMRVLAHGFSMEEFAREIGTQDIDVRKQLLAQAAPSMVAVIGNRDAGKSHLISGLAEVPLDEFAEVGTMAEYRFLHHNEYPPVFRYDNPEYVYIEHKSSILKMLTFVEIRGYDQPGVIPPDLLIAKSEGILFLIDATDPWSGSLWKHFENYVQTHYARIVIAVSKIDEIHEKDWPVLQKHLEEKIGQLTQEKFPFHELNLQEVSTYQNIRSYLEDKAVGESKWNELCDLDQSFAEGFNFIEQTLVEQQRWLKENTTVEQTLREELRVVRQRVRLELLTNIEGLGLKLEGQASYSLKKLRSCLSTKDYLKSFYSKGISTNGLQDGLKNIFSDALMNEINQHYVRMNSAVEKHSRSFSERYPVIPHYCKSLDTKNKDFTLSYNIDHESVQNEVRKALAQLRIKGTLNGRLHQIDELTSVRLRLGVVVLIAAGILGSFLFHKIAFTCVFLSTGLVLWTFWRRKQDLDEFFEFLEEWLLGIGHRMSEPMDRLSTSLVNQAMDEYIKCFSPFVEVVVERKNSLPQRLNEAKDLYRANRYLVDELQLTRDDEGRRTH